ncbi:MAG: hypothetical protein E7544_09100 [Ruminococcaceae bacterium]|nr:hypothetical protein [Oscillospiraceae bacterium]
MSETTNVPVEIKKALEELYKNSPALNELNSVEGFNPFDFVRFIVTDNGEPQIYMDVKNRKVWFRLKHKAGKISKIIHELDTNHATIEARVYANNNDAENDYLANAFATRYFNPEDKIFGKKFVELAEVAATGRALSDAGFNIHGGNVITDDADPAIVDAGIRVDGETGDMFAPSDVLAPPSTPSETTGKKADKAPAAATPTAPAAASASAPAQKPPVVLSPDMSVEELRKHMTVETANKVIITEGFPTYRNKTLGWLSTEKPAALNYFKEKAQSNLLRVAAAFLIEAKAQPAG